MQTKITYAVSLQKVKDAAATIKEVAVVTPLVRNPNYSQQFKANILLNKKKIYSL